MIKRNIHFQVWLLGCFAFGLALLLLLLLLFMTIGKKDTFSGLAAWLPCIWACVVVIVIAIVVVVVMIIGKK